MALSRSQRGFSLIELVMVIVILGVVGATVAVFMRKPVDAYVDTSRRAALSDLADTAVRRIARDVRRALPNSVRNPSNQCIEFIPTRTGGRYRAETTSAGAGDILDFGIADTSFGVFADLSSLPADQRVVSGDVVVVYNLGIPGADAYAGDNSAVVASVATGAESTITMAAKQFPLASAANRFHVVPGDEKIVSFVCSGGRLLRSSNHSYASSCPTTGATVAVLAHQVSACNFVYNDNDLQRNAQVQMTIVLTDTSGDSVSLYHEVHVSNTP
jgi:MSHA biogenesis protein MshO